MEQKKLDNESNSASNSVSDILNQPYNPTSILSVPIYDPMNHWTEYLCVEKMQPTAIIPTRGSEKAVGYDLYAFDTILMKPWESKVHKTQIKISMPPGANIYGRIASRSGLACKHGIEVGAGVIDPDYQGEILVLLRNLSPNQYLVKAKSKIAQIIFEKCYTPEIKEVSSIEQLFGKTKRGDKGIGSTGY